MRIMAAMIAFQSKLSIVLAVLVMVLSSSTPAFCEGSSAIGTNTDAPANTNSDTAGQNFVETVNAEKAADDALSASTKAEEAKADADTDTDIAAGAGTAEDSAAEACSIESRNSAANPDSKQSRLEYLNCVKKTTGNDKIAPLVRRKGKKPVVALVLGGGGTRGAAHVGVLRVLERENIKPDMVVGTSMGAIVGGFYCAGVSIDQIEARFRDTSLMKHFMTVSIPVRILVAPVMLLPRLFVHPYDGLYAGGRFRKFLYSLLPDDEKKIEDLKLPFAAIAVNLLDGNVHALTSGSLAHAMQASSAVPSLRKPVEIGDYLFCDGAMIENVPVGEARRLGAEVVIAVNVDEQWETKEKDHFRRIGSVAKRIVGLKLYNMDRILTEKADVTIHPVTTGISLISRNRKDAAKAIESGVKAAEQAIPAIRKAIETQAGNI